MRLTEYVCIYLILTPTLMKELAIEIICRGAGKLGALHSICSSDQCRVVYIHMHDV